MGDYEKQGTGFDPGAAGYETQGRRGPDLDYRFSDPTLRGWYACGFIWEDDPWGGQDGALYWDGARWLFSENPHNRCSGSVTRQRAEPFSTKQEAQRYAFDHAIW